MAEKISVLMVDDEAKFRETTSKILRKRGFDAAMAGSGEEAVEMLKEKARDVVVLDIRMPGMDGHEALAKMKEIRPDTQVIMLTGHGDVDSARGSLEKGAYDYLNKPCDIDLLTSKINQAYRAICFEEDKAQEKNAGDIMIHVEDYTTITGDKTIREAIQQLLNSFEGLIASGSIMETGHRSILVFDSKGDLAGILSIQDLIEAVRPAYLRTSFPSTAGTIRYSNIFWSGLFTTQTKVMGDKRVEEVMSESPPSVDISTNLMELTDLMHQEQIRRVVVTRKGKVVGVVREQELFLK